MKKIKLTDYFEVINPVYSYYKLTPNKSLRNYNAEQIAIVCTNLYKEITKRISKEDKKYWYTRQSKVLYYTYLEKSKIEFYFILPYEYRNILLDKITNCWKNITVTEIVESDLPLFSKEAVKFAITYKYKDFLSVNTNMSNNFLLSSICNTVNVMGDGDKCGVLININSVSKMSMSEWKSTYQNMLDRFRNGYPPQKICDERQLLSLFFRLVYLLFDFIMKCVSDTFGLVKGSDNKIINNKELSNETTNKKYALILSSQIVVLSQSDDKNKAKQNAISICQSFDVLRGDNEFEYRTIKTDFAITDTVFKKVDKMKMSSKEGGKLFELAGRELIEQYGIAHINTQETQVIEMLQNGKHCLGINTYKGNEVKAYLPVDYNFAVMPVCLIGEQGAGKTCFIGNMVHSIQKEEESCIVIDYIKNCELSEDIIKKSPKDKIVVLDFSNVEDLQGFCYNEIRPFSDSAFDRIDCINRKSLCVETLIDALNVSGDPLSVSMDMILNAACNVVFTQEGTSLKDVIKCLTEIKYRHTCISGIPNDLKSSLSDEVATLSALDAYDKNGNGDTKVSKIEGILSRISLLRKDTRLKYMFNKAEDGNINFVDIMEQHKTLIIKMPQNIFSSPYVRNTMVCYLFTKIWSATLIRGALHEKPTMATLCIDELFQCPTLLNLFSEQEILPQLRKFGLRCMFSCQHLEQMKKINDTLKAAGSSYMYLKGGAEKDFDYMKNELSPFEYEDLKNIKLHDSINLINTQNGRVPFITTLPKPLNYTG